MSQRIQRINQLIKEELSKILLRESEFSPGILVTITRVETSSDLDDAKVFISTIPENKKEAVIAILKKTIYQLQQKLNQRLKMRPIPRIYFVLERETAKAGRIEEILEGLKKEKK